MWELDHKEGWVLKNWCFWTMLLEKTLESPLDNKEIKPVNLKGNQPWIFRTNAEAPIFWPPDMKSKLIGKVSDAGKNWGQEEKEVTEGEMVGWHHWLNGHEFEQLQEIVKDREAWRAAVHEVEKSWAQLINWTTTNACWLKSLSLGWSFTAAIDNEHSPLGWKPAFRGQEEGRGWGDKVRRREKPTLWGIKGRELHGFKYCREAQP